MSKLQNVTLVFTMQKYTHYPIREVSDVDTWPDWTWTVSASE